MLQQDNMSSDRLVKMTPDELASKEIKEERQKVIAEDLEARDTHWLSTHRKEIQEDLGLDPSATWDYDENDDEGLSEPDVENPDS
jgi:hypothetical protein